MALQQRDDFSDRSRGRDRDRALDDSLVEFGSASSLSPKVNNPRRLWTGFNAISFRRLAVTIPRTRLGLQLLTVAACLSWMTASSWAILVNKHIMVNLKFPYPCTIAWMGLLTTTIASYGAMKALARAGAGGGALAGTSLAAAVSVTPRVTPRYYLTRVLPTGFFMALTFQTGNMGYLYLTVAFVQMLKAFCPVVTMLLLFVARLEAPSSRLVAAVTLIAAGVALASYGELNLSLFGLTAMLISVVAESVRLVMTQYMLAGGGSSLHPVEGLFYISSACTAVLAVQASYMEWPRLLHRRDYLLVPAHSSRFAAAACCGFLVNMLAITVIKLASSLTLKVLGTIKDAALVTIGIVFLREHVSSLQLVGYTISMVGFVSYNLIKAQQQQQQQQRQGLGGGGTVGGGGGGVRPLLLPTYTLNGDTAISKAR